MARASLSQPQERLWLQGDKRTQPIGGSIGKERRKARTEAAEGGKDQIRRRKDYDNKEGKSDYAAKKQGLLLSLKTQ